MTGWCAIAILMLSFAMLRPCGAQIAHSVAPPVGGPTPLRHQGISEYGLIADVPFTEQTGTIAHDKSGSGNDCTFGTGINSPTWNGIGIAEGPESMGVYGNQYCTFPAALPTAARTVAVCAYLPTGTEMSALDGDQPGLNGVLSFATLLGAQNRPGTTLMMQAPLGTARVYYQQSAYFNNGGFSSATNDMSIGWNCFFYVFGSYTDSPSTVDHLYKNGIEVSSYAYQTGSEKYLPLTGMWYLGGGGFTDTLQFVGTFEHVLAWNRMLSAPEIASTWQALQAEMIGRGINFSPPTSQTTDSVADCLGDSQTVGSDGAISWCTAANLPLPAESTQLNNNAEGGTTCVSMESGFPLEEALDWSPNAPHTVLMLYCGINDIIVSNETPAEIWARQLAICQLARKAGYEKVLDVTLPSWVDQDTNVQGTDALIRSNWQSCFSSVIDLANNPTFGATGAYTNPTYFQQGGVVSHLTSAGEAVLGQYAFNNLASVYGNGPTNATVINATSYTMLATDNDVVARTPGSSITLPDCLGYPPGHARFVSNESTGVISVVAQQSEDINNSQVPLSIGTGVREQFVVQLVSPTAAGCTWLAQPASSGMLRRR